MWRRFEAEGVEWEVRSVPSLAGSDGSVRSGEEILEFRSSDVNLPARQVVVESGILAEMGEQALLAAFQRAHPIGGDHYGRPGKKMGDVAGS
jgi:hypothetical protein